MNEETDALQTGLDQTRAYWEERARAPGTDLDRLEWTHHRTQRMRYEAFLVDHDLDNCSVLDLGCGYAGFFVHLQQRGIQADYTGYDLSPELIRQCRLRYPDQRFDCGNFLEYQPHTRFDYTVAFGIHNIRVHAGRAILEQVTRRQFEISRIAAHVSLLTDRHRSFASHIQAWRAEEIFSMALTITPYVALHHDYLHNDFSVTLYREPISRTRGSFLLQYEHE